MQSAPPTDAVNRPVGMPGGFAAAKVNLCLHVTGRRDDGYHLLDSLAVFAAVGDRVEAVKQDTLELVVDGPFGAGLAAEGDNLVLRAGRTLAEVLDRPAGARLRLRKYLPVASGIGGGSADAAAALRVLAALWDAPPAVMRALPELALRLGADVPVCLGSQAARMRGIGERINLVALPVMGLLLVNPGVAVSTREVFRMLEPRASGALPLEGQLFHDAGQVAAWLRATGNDLQRPAVALCPPIGTVLAAIQATRGCLMARMSGSGATCFGLYADGDAARAAVSALGSNAWWIWGGQTLDADV